MGQDPESYSINGPTLGTDPNLNSLTPEQEAERVKLLDQLQQSSQQDTNANGEYCPINDSTRPGSKYPSIDINVTPDEFQKNLLANGYTVMSQGESTNGPYSVLSNGNLTYTVYTATSTGEASAQVFNSSGETTGKLRFVGH